MKLNYIALFHLICLEVKTNLQTRCTSSYMSIRTYNCAHHRISPTGTCRLLIFAAVAQSLGGCSKRDFIAYYRYRELGEGNTTYTIDVSNQSSQKNIDLMGAARVTGKHKNAPNVAFVFTHKLVKLALTLQPDGTSLTSAPKPPTT